MAHALWRGLLNPSDTVIDATCGNGNDTYFLSTLLPSGKIYAIDIQEQAIQNTKEKLKNTPCAVEYIVATHANFPPHIPPVKLITYNLGYLPGYDKQITTMASTTLESLKNGLQLLLPDGALSIMLYPGHEEGARETKAVLEWAQSLSHRHYTWGDNPLSPSLLWVTSLSKT